MDRHLRAYARGELPKADASRDAVVLPLAAIESVKKAKAEAQAALERAEAHQKHAEAQAARADKLAFTLAQQPPRRRWRAVSKRRAKPLPTFMTGRPTYMSCISPLSSITAPEI